ncbi:sensor histidine kinase [Paenibacillus sp. PL91]|uniref:cache domain-containing sensor histidine kinase n=1 Tax=Paenibacillus sp. PL91 TaxID=2729538 RepID=UPI00145F1255|nr:histidine kinase [Paenibacillus sp. PL91]MBC9199224.1 histidine kinase [Paenibacillus sp. PL91]
MTLLKFIRNLRLRQKLLLSYVTVIFLPTIVLGLYAYHNSKSSLESQFLQSADNEAKKVTLEISYRLQRQDVSIKSIVFHPTVIELMSNPNLDLYTQFMMLNDKIEPIFFNLMYMVRDMNEIMLYSESHQSELGNFMTPSSAIKDKDWYLETKGSDTTKWWFEDGELFATRVIYNIEFRTVSAVLYVRFDYNKIFGDFIGRVNGGNGIIITDRQNRPVLSEHVGQMDDAQLQSLSRKGTSKARLGGESYLVVNKDIPQTDWILHYLVPDNQYKTGIGNILSATGIIVLICMVFLSIIIFLFSETLLKGIEKLNTKMKMVEDGDLTIVVSANSKDEIGQLTNRFGSMLKQINQLISEVYQTKITQKSAELKALQAQINPHFLYNSLSLINSKALRIDAQEISDLVNHLSSYYRTTLNKGKEIISIQDEWTNVQAYIHIQLAMHNKRFDVEFDVDDKVFQFEMIHLILQPIVENSIMHGIDLKREGRGRLILRASLDGEDIVFVVEDNGVGMEPYKIERILKHESAGYGIKNVQERLQLLFGSEYGISIHSQSGIGTSVIVRIPQYRHISEQ